VDILVTVLRPPNGPSETANVTGEWHATGQPNPTNCSAVLPNQFNVPIVVIGQKPVWHVMLNSMKQIQIDTGIDCALQWSPTPAGPWLNIGKGQSFTLNTEMPTGFFHRLRRLGGEVSGSVTDSSGHPISNVKIGLPYGGPSTITDGGGQFVLPRLPFGMNLLAISNLIGASLNLEIPANTNTAVGFKMAFAGGGTATNACNCTPWCAIGFGSMPTGQTPVYFSGGANPPKPGPADCGQAQVTVTPPSGVPFSIQPGSSRHQNSGPNPASGTWTVTTTVCGHTKTASVDVP